MGSEIPREFRGPRRALQSKIDHSSRTFAPVRRTLFCELLRANGLTWVYTEAADEAGLVENGLASFWKPALSHVYATATTPPVE